VTLRPELAQVLDDLLRRPERSLSLDSIGDAIGALFVTPDEIGAILDALEGAGRSIAVEQSSARQSLAGVLGAARELSRELGRKPTALEIAERSGLSLDAVRTALLFARVLQR